MTVESGKNGTVKIGATPIVDVTSWTLDQEITTSRYASNNTSGFKATVGGVRSATGTIECKWDGAAAGVLITDGVSVTLLLYTNATELYTVPAILKNHKLKVDINDGEVIGFTSDFESNGSITQPTLT